MKQNKLSAISNKNVTETTQNGTNNVIEYYNIPLSKDIQDYIFKLCEKYDLSTSLVIAVINVETGGTFNNALRHTNTNKTVDFGLMQLNSSNHKWFGEMIDEPEFNAGNVYHNLHAGIKYLSILKTGLADEYSDDELKTRFLNQYNMGVSGYKKYVRNTGKISRSYSDRILKLKNKYEKES